MQHLIRAVVSRRLELALTAFIASGLLVFGATALFWLESDIQPDKFGSIPRALWWAIITLTMIGFGDVYPVTIGGNIVAAFVAICGIGLIAMPTGILAAAFSDTMERSRRDKGECLKRAGALFENISRGRGHRRGRRSGIAYGDGLPSGFRRCGAATAPRNDDVARLGQGEFEHREHRLVGIGYDSGLGYQAILEPGSKFHSAACASAVRSMQIAIVAALFPSIPASC